VSLARDILLRAGTAKARERLARLEKRGETASARVEADVRKIIADVRRGGDAALIRLTKKHDGVLLTPKRLQVSADDLAAAFRDLPARARADLQLAARRIRAFHARQQRQGDTRSWAVRDADGARLGQLVRPMTRVGVYVPGGRAAYPSTVLMTVVPARVAGVPEVLAVSPAGVDGHPQVILAACHVAGVDALYRVGGAQAVAALAYGTKTIPRVDKIVGPGNIWVATAKQLCFGQVDIDSIAGPSEVLIVADASADPALVAADMLAQAEHDPEAAAICLTPSARVGAAVAKALETQLATLERRGIAARAVKRFGAIVVTDSLNDALALADALAPEHLELLVRNAGRVIPKLRNAGAIFVGPHSPEAFGDYLAGPNHVLPTGGTARYASPLGVHDFVKRTSLIEGSARSLGTLGPAVARLARLEGLTAHARSVERRLAGTKGGA